MLVRLQINEGTVEVTVRDAKDEVVYQGTWDGASGAPPSLGLSTVGEPGKWRITVDSTALTSQDLHVTVEGTQPHQ